MIAHSAAECLRRFLMHNLQISSLYEFLYYPLCQSLLHQEPPTFMCLIFTHVEKYEKGGRPIIWKFYPDS